MRYTMLYAMFIKRMCRCSSTGRGRGRLGFFLPHLSVNACANIARAASHSKKSKSCTNALGLLPNANAVSKAAADVAKAAVVNCRRFLNLGEGQLGCMWKIQYSRDKYAAVRVLA